MQGENDGSAGAGERRKQAIRKLPVPAPVDKTMLGILRNRTNDQRPGRGQTIFRDEAVAKLFSRRKIEA